MAGGDGLLLPGQWLPLHHPLTPAAASRGSRSYPPRLALPTPSLILPLARRSRHASEGRSGRVARAPAAAEPPRCLRRSIGDFVNVSKPARRAQAAADRRRPPSTARRGWGGGGPDDRLDRNYFFTLESRYLSVGIIYIYDLVGLRAFRPAIGGQGASFQKSEHRTLHPEACSKALRLEKSAAYVWSSALTRTAEHSTA